MKSRCIWAMGVALLMAFLAGCDNNKTTTMGPEPEMPPPPPEERYPADRGMTAAPADTTYTPPPGPSTAAPPAEDVYAPPPVDADHQLPPAERPRTAARPRNAQAPSGSYARTAPRQGQTYTVKKGDTLQKISSKFYGTTTQWRKIHQANKSTIKNPDKLQVGMKLTIPPK